MPQSLQCPECHAHLELPSLAGEQTLQCPRCQHVFAAVQPKPVVKRAMPTRQFDEEPTPNEAMPLPRPRPLRGEWLGKAAMVLISLSLLSYTAQLYLHEESMQIEKGELVLGGREARFFRGFAANAAMPAVVELDQRRDKLEQWERLANPIHHGLFWLAALAFLGWAFCASTNTWNLHAAGMHFVPMTAVIAFFIPILNFYWPYLVFQEIWRASHPRALEPADAWKNTAGLRLVVAWWICVVAGMCLWIFRKPIGLEAELGHEPDLVELFASLSHLIAIVEGVLLILIIRAIMRRQEERHARLCELSTGEAT